MTTDDRPQALTEASPRLAELARVFRETVTSPAFPCIYTKIPFASGSVRYAHRMWDDPDLLDSIVSDLRGLVSDARQSIDAMLVVFVDDVHGTVPTLREDRQLAGSIVTTVMASSPPRRAADGCPVSPQDPEWELELEGLGLFINFSSPRHQRRRSRNVGPAFTVIAQARASFDVGGRSSSSARALIRARIADYDDTPRHPALGSFGDPDNREALQYFLGDDSRCHDLTVEAKVTHEERAPHGHPSA